jgi:hypothetical protein
MRTTAIYSWIDVMIVACPPDRTPTPTIPRGGGLRLGRLDATPLHARGAR